MAGVGNHVLIGAPTHDTGETNAGAAYLFDGATGVLLQTFTNPTPVLSDQFGFAVAGAGNNVLVGAPFDDSGVTNAGAAYLFDGTTGGLLQTFLNPAPGPATNDLFSFSVSAFGSNVLIVVGTPQDAPAETNSGTAYLFDGSTGSLLQTILNPDTTPDAGDQFGFAVAAAGNNLIIGAPTDDDPGATDAGSAYLYSSGNQPPVADAGADQSVECTSPSGTPVTLDGSNSTDPDEDQLTFTWRENGDDIATGEIAEVTLGPGTHTIELTVDDGNGGTATDQVIVTVKDPQPAVIAQINAPVDPIQVNTAINTSATFTDACVVGTHTALWDWADGSTSPGTVDETNGTVTGNHTYTTAGVYTLKLTVTDNAGKSGEAFFRYVVVYDPIAGYVTGGGWIDSPPGAYVDNPGLTGKANFGFVSKYPESKTTPKGNTQFNFKVADLKFHSTSYDWLMVGGAHTKYKGSGTIDNSGDYGFLVTATDGQMNGGGGVDKFRIKIWSKATETVVYDNQFGASEDADAGDPIAGGSIVIHSTSSAKSSETSADDAMPVALPESYALLQNYPNPFNPETEIRFQLPEASHVTVKIFNTLGENIRTLVDSDFAAGTHAVRWNARNERGEKAPSGVYFYQLVTPRFTETKRMILAK
ncbi:PKD domain-containing protein [candidate division KSB1 bacterium]|nr:PKD domain-containing protein [candidate division KSB1 bacterium]